MTDWAAGPALDAEICRKIMGWVPVQVRGLPTGDQVWWYSKRRGEGVCGPPPYSTDLATAMRILDVWDGDCLLRRQNGHWHVELCQPSQQWDAWAETLPVAICLARLRAVVVEVPA